MVPSVVNNNNLNFILIIIIIILCMILIYKSFSFVNLKKIIISKPKNIINNICQQYNKLFERQKYCIKDLNDKLIEAVRKNDLYTINKLTFNFNINKLKHLPYNFVQECCSTGKVEILEILYEFEFDLSYLKLAVYNNHPNVVSFIMSKNIDIKNPNDSLVEYAIINNFINILDKLIPEGTIMDNDYYYLSLNSREDNDTLLSFAVKSNKLDSVKFLVNERGCKLLYHKGSISKYINNSSTKIIFADIDFGKKYNDLYIKFINNILYDVDLSVSNYNTFRPKEIDDIIKYIKNNGLLTILEFLCSEHLCFQYVYNINNINSLDFYNNYSS